MGSFSLSGGVEVFGFISPSNTTDQYPVIDPLYGIDGLRNVNTLSDLNLIPTLRRRAGMIVGVSGGTTYYKLNSPPWSLTLSDWTIFNSGSGGDFLPLSGGTVSGGTIFTNGLTANTFSATTYLGLPSDIYVSGFTYLDNILTIQRSSGNPNLFVTINDFTGLTINGNLNVTGNTIVDGISANTISASTYLNLPIDVFVTGGTYDNVTGIATFTNNTGGTFNISGLFTGSTDVFVTGGTYSDNTFTFTNNTGGTFNVSFNSVSGLTINGDLNVTGNTIVDGITANTISATTYQNLPIDPDTYITAFTYNNNTLTIDDNSGNTFNTTINDFTGLTINGDLSVTGSSVVNSLTANTISGSSYTITNSTQNNSLDEFLVIDGNGDFFTRNFNSINKLDNTITVALSGGSADFTSIESAVNSITGSSSANTYVVQVAGGVYYENPFTIPTWVSVVGESSVSTIIEAIDPSQTLIKLSDQSALFDCQVQGCTGIGVSAILYSSSTTPQSSAISYVENVRFGSNYTHAKVVASSGANIIMQCSNVKYGGYPFTIGFYATNDGSGIGRMQLRNVTSTNGGIVTTTGLIFAKADAQSCGFIVNGCLLTKAVGAAAGTGFYVENGGFLRLTAVNFQRWSVGIDAPQIGSAPSIDAIALNFENNTIDVNIVHSGTTGKIQGTDNFLKTLININAPIYEVNQDPRQITVAKKGGDFSSIKSAVDYLIASGNTSLSNRFVITVGPGFFYENEIDLTQTPYVSIVGSNIQTTQILPNSSTQHILKIGQNNEVSFLSFSGAGLGYAAIYCYDIGDFGQAHKCSFTDCDTNVWVESVTQDTNFYGEYLDFNGSYTYGTKVIATNGFVALANMENYYNFPIGTGITYCNYATGSGATLSIFVGDNQSNGVSGSTAYYIQDGAELNASTITIDGFTYGIRNPNIGDGVRFDVDNASVINGEWDLYIERSTTFGTFGGSSNHQKIFTNSSDVYWVFLDIDDGELDITRKASVTFTDGSHTDFTTLIFEGGSMGLISGGSLSVVSGTTIQADGGFGYLEKSDNSGIVRRIDWINNLITLSANTDEYIFINENSNLSSSGTRPNSAYNILLGRVVTNSTDVEFIDLSPFNAEHTSNRYGDLLSNALGPIYATGSIVTEGVTPFTLDVTSGEYYFATNQFLPSGGTNLQFVQYYRNGTGSTWVTSATTFVNNTSYDNNGTLTGLTTSYFTKHTLYLVGEGSLENYFLVLGQNEYSTLLAAENGLLPTPPSFFSDSVTQIANIYVQQGASGVTIIEDIRPTIAFRAGGVNASSVHGNLLGLSADDHTQYLLVSGARAMSGNLDMGLNDITNVGLVDGVTVSSHATRHQFGGADPVGTTTPSPNAIPYADVSGTLDDWISTGTTSTLGKVKLSVSPISASDPIVVGDNDLRVTQAISGGSFNNSTDTLTLNRNDGTTLQITGFTDVFVTGGTFNSGSLTFTNNTGGTFSVSGISSFDTFVTGFTYSDNTFTISQNSGTSLTATINSVTGLTASTISAATFNGNIVALNGTSVTNPTYRTSLAGSNLSPRATFGSETTAANTHRYIFDPVNQNGLVFSIANNGSVYIARGGIVAGGSGSISQEIGDLRFFTLNSPNATLFSERMRLDHFGNLGIGTTSPSEKLDVVGKTKTSTLQVTSGATNGYTLISDSSGNAIWTPLPTFTGGTVTGSTNFTNGLTANTISATTYQNLPIDVFVTGGTYSNGDVLFTNNTGGTFNVSGFFTGYTNVVNSVTAGVGLSGDTTTGDITLINTSPDQIVTISGGTGITTGGTYPDFTITNSLPDQVVTLSGGTNISITGTYPNFNISFTGSTTSTFDYGKTYAISNSFQLI